MSRDKTTIETLKACREFMMHKTDCAWEVSGGRKSCNCALYKASDDLDALITQGDDLPEGPSDGSKPDGTPSYVDCCRFVARQVEHMGYLPYCERINELCDYADALRSHAQALAARLAGLEQGE